MVAPINSHTFSKGERQNSILKCHRVTDLKNILKIVSFYISTNVVGRLLDDGSNFGKTVGDGL